MKSWIIVYSLNQPWNNIGTRPDSEVKIDILGHIQHFDDKSPPPGIYSLRDFHSIWKQIKWKNLGQSMQLPTIHGAQIFTICFSSSKYTLNFNEVPGIVLYGILQQEIVPTSRNYTSVLALKFMEIFPILWSRILSLWWSHVTMPLAICNE